MRAELHSAAATRNESINDIIERMNAEYHCTDPSNGRSAIRVPASGPAQLDDLDLLAGVGRPRAAATGAAGPAAILEIFVRVLQRARWALYRNKGRASRTWSLGEQLSVALVLGDGKALADLGYTPEEAAEAVSTALALPSYEMEEWIGELRAVV